MKAQILETAAPVETAPLQYITWVKPIPKDNELLVRVSACGVCHTDLHVVEGELPDPLSPVIPGHQVVGEVAAIGGTVTRFRPGTRVGIPWLHETCGDCEYCQRGLENLCDNARFTGYTAQGGFAEYTTVPEDFAIPLPDSFSDLAVAPLLCGGIVGYRSLLLSEVRPGERLGLYGFGGSAHIVIQVARHWGCHVYVFTRSKQGQQLGLDLGAAWAGEAQDDIPVKLDRAIIFAPAGWLVLQALRHLRKAGTLCINAIHTTPIPAMKYHMLWHERTIRTVANATRQDAEEFISLAAEIGIETTTQQFDLPDANYVLARLKNRQMSGTGVLMV